jgi:multidrug efflux system outer membrane protein
MSARKHIAGLPLLAMLAAGCAAPAFRQPQVEVPTAFREAGNAVQTAADGTTWVPARQAEVQARGAWWRAFGDAQLNDFVARAGRAGPTLDAALARLRQARAIAGMAEADRRPQLGVEAGARRARAAPAERGAAPGSPSAPSTSYRASLNASYEVDLFGRVAANVAAARADAAGAAAAYRSVLLALQADVVQTYLRLRALDAEQAALDGAVALHGENVRINERRFALGDIGEFDLSRARTELAAARAEAIALARRRAVAEHALAVLLGETPATFAFDARPLLEGEAMPAIPAGLPSTLLERRPDIAAAQRAMEAANARIGVARAAMFPALSIGASGGGVADTVRDIGSYGAHSWMLGALLSMPVVDGGRNQANVERSRAAFDEAVGLYRQRVLTAFGEAEDSLASVRVLAAEAAEVDRALASARRSADLARRLYDAGRSSYLDLLDAQRALTSVQRQAAVLRGERALAAVALVRALGGGWDAPAAEQVALR